MPSTAMFVQASLQNHAASHLDGPEQVLAIGVAEDRRRKEGEERRRRRRSGTEGVAGGGDSRGSSSRRQVRASGWWRDVLQGPRLGSCCGWGCCAGGKCPQASHSRGLWWSCDIAGGTNGQLPTYPGMLLLLLLATACTATQP